MPRLSSSAPCFPVADVGATVRWYEAHLGFTSYPFPKTEPHAFASLVRDDVEIMLQRIEGYQKPDLYALRGGSGVWDAYIRRSEEHTSELQSQSNLVCRLLLEKKKST